MKNTLDEQFNPSEPDEVWCSDITYIWTFEGFVYLTSIMELFSRKIIAWVLSDTLEAKWVVEAIRKAKRVRKTKNPKVIHSHCGYLSPNEYEGNYWKNIEVQKLEAV